MKKPVWKLNPSDLPVMPGGRIYHLDITKDQLANNIILVGDRDRATEVAKHFDVGSYFKDRTIEINHREFRTITGKYEKKPITVIGTGIGTDNMEIVLTEIDALKRFDLEAKKPLEKPPRLTIIRVGTSGALQKKTLLGTAVITNYAVGFDNTGLFYNQPAEHERIIELEKIVYRKITEATPKKSRFYGKIHPYAANANDSVSLALVNSALELDVPFAIGITAAASGFFGCQGRDLGVVPLTIRDLDGVLSKIKFHELKFENFEMETSLLFHYAKALGHRAGAICTTLANRRENTFNQKAQKDTDNAIRVALQAIKYLNS